MVHWYDLRPLAQNRLYHITTAVTQLLFVSRSRRRNSRFVERRAIIRSKMRQNDRN